jgi:hypothetical protein
MVMTPLGDPDAIDAVASVHFHCADLVGTFSRQTESRDQSYTDQGPTPSQIRSALSQSSAGARNDADTLRSIGTQLRAVATQIREELAQIAALAQRVEEFLKDHPGLVQPAGVPGPGDPAWNDLARALGPFGFG